MDKVQRMAGMPPIPSPRGRSGFRGMELHGHSCWNVWFLSFSNGSAGTELNEHSVGMMPEIIFFKSKLNHENGRAVKIVILIIFNSGSLDMSFVSKSTDTHYIHIWMIRNLGPWEPDPVNVNWPAAIHLIMDEATSGH